MFHGRNGVQVDSLGRVGLQGGFCEDSLFERLMYPDKGTKVVARVAWAGLLEEEQVQGQQWIDVGENGLFVYTLRIERQILRWIEGEETLSFRRRGSRWSCKV